MSKPTRTEIVAAIEARDTKKVTVAVWSRVTRQTNIVKGVYAHEILTNSETHPHGIMVVGYSDWLQRRVKGRVVAVEGVDFLTALVMMAKEDPRSSLTTEEAETFVQQAKKLHGFDA